jgi:hypothetical protein
MRLDLATRLPVLFALAILFPSCAEDRADGADAGVPDSGPDVDTDSDSDGDTDPDGGAAADGWPDGNEWSWDGSWTPGDEDFPIDGLHDDEYFDGHLGGDGEPTPILPPGAWDWNDADDDLANWRNFEDNLGAFEMLLDSEDRHYGWRLAPNDPGACDYSGPAMYFEGSSGPDVLRLGAGGAVHSFASGNLADGPDVLVFEASWSLDFRTGSSESGALRDDDLVMAGCGGNPDGAFDVTTSTIHTGPGADWVFVRDISRAAIDLGNGANGRTDTLDPDDGDDLVVLRGNTQDFRVMGGAGDDVAVWRVDENVQTTTWLGPNFFGGGGAGDALWGDAGTDLLVLDIPADTLLVTAPPTPPGGLLVMGTDGSFIPDEPTAADPYAAYCVECGESPEGRRTVIMEYVSADESVQTGYFYVTAFERLQVGVGDGARVFAIDDVAGAVTELPGEPPYAPPAWPSWECD